MHPMPWSRLLLLRPAQALAALGVAVTAVPLVHADTTQAWCLAASRANDAPVPKLRRCTFSQRQGNAEVRLPERTYAFAATQDGKDYRRSADPEGLRFETTDLLLTVYWQQPKVYSGSPRCSMNRGLWRRCTISPLPGVRDGFEVRFAGRYDAPLFRFRPAPGSQPTTHGRLMLDGSGQRWRFRGHHSFSLSEEGGYRNRLDVAVDR